VGDQLAPSQIDSQNSYSSDPFGYDKNDLVRTQLTCFSVIFFETHCFSRTLIILQKI
jgi:hypothetical protein